MAKTVAGELLEILDPKVNPPEQSEAEAVKILADTEANYESGSC